MMIMPTADIPDQVLVPVCIMILLPVGEYTYCTTETRLMSINLKNCMPIPLDQDAGARKI